MLFFFRGGRSLSQSSDSATSASSPLSPRPVYVLPKLTKCAGQIIIPPATPQWTNKQPPPLAAWLLLPYKLLSHLKELCGRTSISVQQYGFLFLAPPQSTTVADDAADAPTAGCTVCMCYVMQYNLCFYLPSPLCHVFHCDGLGASSIGLSGNPKVVVVVTTRKDPEDESPLV